MKTLKQLFIVAALICGATFASCSNEDTASTFTGDLNQTATFKGKIFIEKDKTLTGDNKVWTAPDSTLKIIAKVDRSSISDHSSGTYIVPQRDIKYDKKTGEYTLELPVAKDKSVLFFITIEDYLAEVTRLQPGTPTTIETVEGYWRINSPVMFQHLASPGTVVYLTPIEANREISFYAHENVGDVQ